MNSKVFKYAGVFLVGVVVLAFVVVLVVLLVGKHRGSSNSNVNGTRVTDSLRFITVISRHGNREAKLDYQNDPYPLNDTRFWQYASFDLTTQGRVEMYKLGQKIRSMYNGLLNSTTFNTGEVHASSTYADRILISGEAFLAGLYPPQGFQVWNKNIPWQPTPLYSDSPDHTVIITSCDRYEEIRTGLTIPFYETNAANYSKIIDYYNNATGANKTKDFAGDSYVWYLWDKIMSEKSEGYKVPEWVAGIYDTMRTLVTKMYLQFYAGTEEMVRLIAGNLFEEMLGVMESVMNGTLPERKIQYYSGHDCSVVALQVLLGITDVVGLVRPGSGLILELHQNSTTNTFTIQVLYIDGSSSDLEPVTLDFPYSDFSTLVNNTQQYMGLNYDQECKISNISRLFLKRDEFFQEY